MIHHVTFGYLISWWALVSWHFPDEIWLARPY